MKHGTLGLLGGTFDPIHNGHLWVARESATRLSLDSVRLIPCGVPTHRRSPMASAQDRVAMLEAALQEQNRKKVSFPKIIIDTREIISSSPNYTHTTLSSLRRENPNAALIWLMGEDAFLGLSHWYRWQNLFDLAHFVVFARENAATLDGAPDALPKELREVLATREIDNPALLSASRFGAVYRMKLPPFEVSSSDIRTALARQDLSALEHLLPKSVLAYIVGHRLYSSL